MGSNFIRVFYEKRGVHEVDETLAKRTDKKHYDSCGSAAKKSEECWHVLILLQVAKPNQTKFGNSKTQTVFRVRPECIVLPARTVSV